MRLPQKGKQPRNNRAPAKGDRVPSDSGRMVLIDDGRPLVDVAIAALIPDAEDSAQIAAGYFDGRSPTEHELDLIATARRARGLAHVAFFIHRQVDGDHGALDQIRLGVDLLLRAERRWPALRAAI